MFATFYNNLNLNAQKNERKHGHLVVEIKVK